MQSSYQLLACKDEFNPPGVYISKIKRKLSQKALKYSVCRMCATYHAKIMLVRLFEPPRPECPKSESLADIINKFLPIKVVEDDQLPVVVCNNCAEKLMAWQETVQMAVDSARILKGQSELANHTISVHNIYKSREFTEMVRTVLTGYYEALDSAQLVCQKCDVKTSNEHFAEHLRSQHQQIHDQQTIEAFVRDYVTFEEALQSDSELEAACNTSDSSNEAATLNKTPRLDCPICSSAFTSDSRLFHHIKSKHPNVKLENGVVCCGIKHDKSNLVKHIAEHATGTVFQCRSCGFLAADNITLATHISERHADPKCAEHRSTPLPATIAPNNLKNENTVSGTVEETNQKKIPAVCPECNLTFSNKYNMLVHMRRHTAAAPTFDCECGKSYTTLGNLTAHRRLAHEGILRHPCVECGRRFPTRSARDVHARLHSGARPYACAECPRAFRAKSSRDRHQDTHAAPRLACRLCGDKFRRVAHLRYHVGTHRKRTSRGRLV